MVDPQELASYLEKNNVVLFVEHAGLVVLIYDYFLTLGSEISFAWTRGPWNLGKVLFFLVRYPAFVSAGLRFHSNTSRSIPLSSCQSWTNAGFYSNLCVVFIVEFVFGLRVWALWGRSRKVAICLVVTIIVLIALGIYKVVMIRPAKSAFGLEIFQISGYCPPQFSGNDAISGSSTVTFWFITVAVYEWVALILTLIKASRQGWLGPHGSGSRFINGFVSQGVAYNCLILVASTANIITRYKLPSAYVNLLTNLQLTLHSVLTSRMMLYLRRNTFKRQVFTDDSLTGIVALDHGLPHIQSFPAMSESCPQISILDVGRPSHLGEFYQLEEGRIDTILYGYQN
ncbi:hypothetical protein L218DRAFT_957243 [Marasmius fiardii PR-910]|nr:hypothetical protein L218DRAFT_957243 [Marasmius fiardii PR-910]